MDTLTLSLGKLSVHQHGLQGAHRFPTYLLNLPGVSLLPAAPQKQDQAVHSHHTGAVSLPCATQPGTGGTNARQPLHVCHRKSQCGLRICRAR